MLNLFFPQLFCLIQQKPNYPLIDSIEITKQENTGYKPLISGAILHLMGSIHAIIKRHTVEREDKELVIQKARLLFRSNTTAGFSPEQAAEELQVVYSWFSKYLKTIQDYPPGNTTFS